ncbi:MAG TPA: hypothetical protein VG501_08880 [Rhizomicrobium sp.]|nr:hypothetical protein [Rhizomicrobium sp.]
MKYMTICVIAVLMIVRPALSQETAKKRAPCVDVEIGQDKAAALNCMNDAIRAQVEHTQGMPSLSPPTDARSPGNQVGTFNNQAAQEQMGSAYGTSSKPQRPKAVFVSPVLPPAVAH